MQRSRMREQETLVITGSSGLIGRAFIRRVGPRYTEIGLDREGPPHPPESTEQVIACDVSSDESVRAAFEEIRRSGHRRIASVIHLAAYYDFSGRPSDLYEQVTVRGTERLLKALEGFDVEQFIFSSTMLVHKPCSPGQRIDEEWPLEPKWDYPKSKVRTEELLKAKRGDIPVVRLRVSGVYDDLCHSIPIAHQIQRWYERRLIARVFPGELSHGQSFLHLDDLVEVLVRCVERRHDLQPDTAMLVGEPETLSYGELQRIISRLLLGRERHTWRVPKPLAKFGASLQDRLPGMDPFIKPWMIDIADDHYALDIGRARRLLDWEPQRSLRETLPKMIATLQSDPAEFYRVNRLKR